MTDTPALPNAGQHPGHWLDEYIVTMTAWLDAQRRYLIVHPDNETLVKAALGLSASPGRGMYEVRTDDTVNREAVLVVPRDEYLGRYRSDTPPGDTSTPPAPPTLTPRLPGDYPPGSGQYLPDGLLRPLSDDEENRAPNCHWDADLATNARYYRDRNAYLLVCDAHSHDRPTD